MTHLTDSGLKVSELKGFEYVCVCVCAHRGGERGERERERESCYDRTTHTCKTSVHMYFNPLVTNVSCTLILYTGGMPELRYTNFTHHVN